MLHSTTGLSTSFQDVQTLGLEVAGMQVSTILNVVNLLSNWTVMMYTRMKTHCKRLFMPSMNKTVPW